MGWCMVKVVASRKSHEGGAEGLVGLDGEVEGGCIRFFISL